KKPFGGCGGGVMADLVVPALGEHTSEAGIAKGLKKVGEPTALDEPVVDLETDKVSVQLPAPARGVLTEQMFAEGATVRVGQVIVRIAEAGAQAASPSPKPRPGPRPRPSASALSRPRPGPTASPLPPPSPTAPPAHP